MSLRDLLPPQALQLYNDAADAFNAYHKAAKAHNECISGHTIPEAPHTTVDGADNNTTVPTVKAEDISVHIGEEEWLEERHIPAEHADAISAFQSIDRDLVRKNASGGHLVKLKDLRSWVKHNWTALSPSVPASHLVFRALTQRLLRAQMGKEVVHNILQDAITKAHDVTVNQFGHHVPLHVVQRASVLQNTLHNFMRGILQQRRGVSSVRSTEEGAINTPPIGFGQFARVSNAFSNFVVKFLSNLDNIDPSAWNAGTFHSRATAGRVITLYAHVNKLHQNGAITIDKELSNLFGIEEGTVVRTNQMQKYITCHIGKKVVDQDTMCLESPPPGKDEWWSLVEEAATPLFPPAKRQRMAPVHKPLDSIVEESAA